MRFTYILLMLLWVLGSSPLSAMSPPPNATASISGKIVDVKGAPMAGVLLLVKDAEGTLVQVVSSDQEGMYELSDLPNETDYTLHLSKNGNWLENLSFRDLHMLSRLLLFNDKIINLLASDVNQNGTVSTLDLVQLTRVLHLIDQGDDLAPAWQFIYAYSPVIANQANPPTNSTAFDGTNLYLDGDIVGLDYVGIKTGNLYQVNN